MDIENRGPTEFSGDLYGPAYYASHCGPVPYARNDHWLRFFGGVADELVRAFDPRRLFDAGCALGLLVESMWDRGVEAYGRDISEFAISQIRADVRPCCQVGSIAEPIEGEFDLLTCIEVLEHMPEQEALRAIGAMAAAAPRILFSSSPTDFDEPTHCNVRPPIYWLARWAELGFAPLPTHDASYLAPHAYVLERSETGRNPRDLAAFADRVRHRVAMSQLGNRLFDVNAELQKTGARLAETQTALDTARQEQALAASARVVAEQEAASIRAEGLRALDEARAKAAEELARVTTQERRLRASAAQRTAGARAEIAELRAELSEMAELRARVHELDAAHAAALGHRTHVQDEVEALRTEVSRRTTERDLLLGSTAWRMTRPARRLVESVPAPLRANMRQSLRLTRWTLTGQLVSRLRGRKRIAADARAIAATPLFDPHWYLARNPDVHLSGLEPAAHYAFAGGYEERDPSPHFSVRHYLEQHPEARASGRPALLHFLEIGQPLGWKAPPVPAESSRVDTVATAAPRLEPPAAASLVPLPAPPQHQPQPTPQLVDLVRARFMTQEPLRTYAAPHDRPRITIVTDSVGTGSLYGGVGTALILAALLARRLGAGLRLVTRAEASTADKIGAVLAVHGIEWTGNIEMLHAPWGSDGRDVPVGPQDIFLTTSWWTTWATRQSVNPARIIYLLQEDERGFYPLGDDHLRCSETLSNPALTYIVNSSLLMDHLQQEGLAPGGVSFDPAFPLAAYHREERPEAAKSNFFFYARPNNLRNLFWRGLETISAAMEEGVLDPAAWNFHFVGKDLPDMLLPGGTRPILAQNMSWADYASLVRTMDLGLSLMDTPHPSYPPLDLAASGAVVVTNRFGVKTSLQTFSPNIICADSTVPALVEGLRQAKKLAADRQARTENYETGGLQRSWDVALAAVLDHLAARFG